MKNSLTLYCSQTSAFYIIPTHFFILLYFTAILILTQLILIKIIIIPLKEITLFKNVHLLYSLCLAFVKLNLVNKFSFPIVIVLPSLAFHFLIRTIAFQ